MFIIGKTGRFVKQKSCFSQISLAVVKRNDDAHEWGVGLAEFPKLDQMLVSAGVYGAELSHFEGARLIVA